MSLRQVIILAAAVVVGAASADARTALSNSNKQMKKPPQPPPAAARRPPATDPAKPIDRTVGIGGLQFKRQEIDTGRNSGARYQTDLTPRKDLYLYGGSSTPGERRPGDTPSAPIDQSRPAATTFGAGLGVRF